MKKTIISPNYRERNNNMFITEYNRWNYVDRKRKNTPCKFKDGISFEEFYNIVHKVAKHKNRIKSIMIDSLVIHCIVESQSGFSKWNFYLDFNNWGHLTGKYWMGTENNNSIIPRSFGDMISEEIYRILQSKNICLEDFSSYINRNKNLGTDFGLSYLKKTGFFRKIFEREKQIVLKYNSCDLNGEHVYLVLSMMKDNGFKIIKSLSIKDVGRESKKYFLEVENVLISGIDLFTKGEIFTDNAEVTIIYHEKKEISIPFSIKNFRNKNCEEVVKQLYEMGFSNIYKRRIKDLVTGWFKKDGSVEEVLIKVQDMEMPMKRNHLYKFDTEIIITYHTF